MQKQGCLVKCSSMEDVTIDVATTACRVFNNIASLDEKHAALIQQRSISSSSCDSDSNLVKMPILNPSYVSVSSDSKCNSRCNSQAEMQNLSAGEILNADLKPPLSPSRIRSESLKRRSSTLRETL